MLATGHGLAFWDTEPHDGSSKHLRNIGLHLRDYMAQCLKRLSSSY
jgi:hypothetical protein